MKYKRHLIKSYSCLYHRLIYQLSLFYSSPKHSVLTVEQGKPHSTLCPTLSVTRVTQLVKPHVRIWGKKIISFIIYIFKFYFQISLLEEGENGGRFHTHERDRVRCFVRCCTFQMRRTACIGPSGTPQPAVLLGHVCAGCVTRCLPRYTSARS